MEIINLLLESIIDQFSALNLVFLFFFAVIRQSLKRLYKYLNILAFDNLPIVFMNAVFEAWVSYTLAVYIIDIAGL